MTVTLELTRHELHLANALTQEGRIIYAVLYCMIKGTLTEKVNSLSKPPG